MTFSILARNVRTGAIGCAAATGNLAVGGWVPRVAADAGAVATQGMAVSSLWGDDALALLRRGLSADEALRAVTAPDAGRDHRQLAILDMKGRGAVWSGRANRDHVGEIVEPGLVISGNWLAGPHVLQAAHEHMVEAGEADDLAGFASTLVSALAAGAAAGGDSRGLFSAAIRICSRAHAPLDLRIDRSEQPIGQLAELVSISTAAPYSDWAKCVPTLDDPYFS